ncbi:MAG: hypothetical protein V3V08_10225 [Nannocystaceae bacterium]
MVPTWPLGGRNRAGLPSRLVASVAATTCFCAGACVEDGTPPDTNSTPSSTTNTHGDAAGDQPDPGTTDDPTSASTPAFEFLGECRFVGSGLFADGRYSGIIDYLLLADEGNGEELCRVRFSLNTVAEPDPPCGECYWSTVARLSEPIQITDIEGACADSERNMGAAGIEARMAETVAMGFAMESTGHGEVLVHYNDDTMQWGIVAFGEWDAETGSLAYDRVEGFCRYSRTSIP